MNSKVLVLSAIRDRPGIYRISDKIVAWDMVSQCIGRLGRTNMAWEGPTPFVGIIAIIFF